MKNIIEKLPNFSITDLQCLAKKIRTKIINAVSINGGHLSSNLGVVELTISLHKNFNFLNDKLLFDIGHQSYTHKILTGNNINKIRQKNGLSGFIKCNESKYDIFEAGHSSTSLSAATAFAVDRYKKHQNYEIVVVIGDASLLNGLSFEALNYISYLKYKIIIVVNNNNMSINKTIGDISILNNKNPNFNFIADVDGHDFNSLDNAFNKAKKSIKPVIINIKTIKGKGYIFSENDNNGDWHETCPFNKKNGQRIAKLNDHCNWQSIYSDALQQKLIENKKNLLICPGTLKAMAFDKIINKFKDQIFDVGISEEFSVIFGSQLSKLNYNVYINIYSTFLQRSFDQILHDVSRIGSNLTFLIDRSGLSGENGETHHGIFDAAFLFSVPNSYISMANDVSDVDFLLNYSQKNKKLMFIRIPKEDIYKKENKIKKNYYEDFNIYNNKNNSEIAIVSVGPITNKLLSQLNNNIHIYNPIILKPINKKMIQYLLKYKKIVIYTPYETEDGYAKYLVNELITFNFKGKIFIKAISKPFIKCMSVKEQLEENKLLPEQIKKFIESLK